MPKKEEISCLLRTALLQWFVRVVTTVIVNVALPALRDAASVAALELAGTAGSGGAVGWVLVRLIAAVIVAITLP